jgi:FeS assembly protein IscX
VEDIAEQLFEGDPEFDPLSIRFTDLRDRIMALPDFGDHPSRVNEKILEAIQLAWVEEFKGR